MSKEDWFRLVACRMGCRGHVLRPADSGSSVVVQEWRRMVAVRLEKESEPKYTKEGLWRASVGKSVNGEEATIPWRGWAEILWWPGFMHIKLEAMETAKLATSIRQSKGGVMILRNCDQKFRYRHGSSANMNQSPGLLLYANGCISCVLLAYPRDYISKLCKRHKPDANFSFQNNLLIHVLTSFIDHLHLCSSMKGSLNQVVEHVLHSLTWQSSHRWLTRAICSKERDI